jgi:hypothetical protein
MGSCNRLAIFSIFLIPLGGCSSGPDCASEETRELVSKIAMNNAENSFVKYVLEHSRQRAELAAEHSKIVADTNEAAKRDKDAVENELNILAQKCISLFAPQMVGKSRNEITGLCCNLDSTLQAKIANECNIWAYTPASARGKDESRARIVGKEPLQYMMNYIQPIRERYDHLNRGLWASERIEKQKNELENDLTDRWVKAKNTATYVLNVIRLIRKDDTTEAVGCAARLALDIPGWGNAEKDIEYTVEKTSDKKLYVTIYGLN